MHLVHGTSQVTAETSDRSEQWGYIEVRQKANMFWWLYRSPHRVEDHTNPWPIILWLQGGPGTSGVGHGSLLEIGPPDVNLKSRSSTWLAKAHLLFADGPVGTGFSYVEDERVAVRTDEGAAADLTTLLKAIFNGNKTLQQTPLFIFGESYGGKFAVTLGLSVLKAIEAGDLKLQLGGVALGDSWISPEDFVFSCGPLLKDVSRLDSNGLDISNSLAKKIKQQLAQGLNKDAADTLLNLEGAIWESSGNNFYNFLLDQTADARENRLEGHSQRRYSSKMSASTTGASHGDLDTLMNGPIKQKLKIIPENAYWVLDGLMDDFMKPRVKEVGELLAKGINVTIYNGQLDLMCSTKGTEAWVEKLQWDGLQNYLGLNRTPFYGAGDDKNTEGFIRSCRNLFFYWILQSGHFVPVDQPYVSLEMVGNITRSPNIT